MQNYTGLEIAVIGMSGRFPGASNVQEFWDNLKNGVESITVLSEEEILAAGEDPSLLQDPAYVKASAFLEGKEYFDAAFFHYRPDEAALMDPQTRLFHECVWQALEDAGCNPADEEHKIALFAGTSINMNWEVYAALANREHLVDAYSAVQLRNARFLPTKIAYAFNLRGPAVFVDTACSTSLAAIHQACRSLIVGDCTIALAGGVAISNRSRKGYKYEQGMIHSPDGHCRPFDKDAQGTVSGEGIGVVVLKKLKKALADKDNVLAVIRGSGINNDGNNKVGYTAPSIDGQMEAILLAQKWGKTEPGSISYVEAHGTGTRLGDPIEVEALTRAFGKSAQPYCAIGAVKSNIGHLDAAAGVAGFIKTVLALQHRQLPASLHYKEANAAINFTDSPFYVNTALKPWRHGGQPLRAGVSSFGIGGTNVHVVLEEAPVPETSTSSRNWHVLPFSASTPAALERNMIAFRDFLTAHPAINLADTAYTLQTGRVALACRSTIVCKSPQEAVGLLADTATAARVQALDDKQAPLTVFMFPGQGAQYVNMCRGLYQAEESFRTTVDLCFGIVQQLSGRDLRSVVFSGDLSSANQSIDHTENTQPLLFIMEYALARLLMQWGIRPDLMIGHSIGEYVAACISGVFSLEDALRLVVKRGALMQQAPRGVMLGVSISEQELHPLLHAHGDISLATVNSSELCVVAGEEEPIGTFRTIIEQSGYKSTLLRTSHAFHSQMMDGILDAFEDEVRRVTIHPQQIPIISNISGKRATDAEISRPAYWVRHLRHTVRFSEGIVTAFENEHVLFIEAGPGQSLSTFVRSHQLRQSGHKVVNIVRHAKEPGDDLAYLLGAIGDCWVHGLTPAWKSYYDKEVRSKVSLPTYSFERVKYPADVDAYQLIRDLQADSSAAKDPVVANWLYTPSWKLAVPLPPQAAAESAACILLFADDCGIGVALAAQLQAKGHNVVQVQAGDQFAELATGYYALNPTAANDYEQLLHSLVKRGLQPRAIVHGWSIGHEQEHGYSHNAYHRCFRSLVQWVQLCQSAGRLQGSSVILLTSDVQPVLDKAGSAAVTSLAPAFLKVLSQEYPSVSSRHIDISVQEVIAGEGLAALCREIDHAASGQVIALRHGRRWEQVYNPVPVNDISIPPDLRWQGVYLITGGLGGVGFVLAGQLLKKLQARVIITGRTILPPRDEWAACLQAPATTAALKTKIKRLQALEGEGGALLYFAGNVANVAELMEMVQNGETAFGPVNGVFHGAGVVDGRSIGAIGGLTEADFGVQFEAKIAGLHALHTVMRGRELDFCLLTSSLAAVLGGIGFGAYAPANAYMDHFIEAHIATTPHWVSVNIDGIDLGGKHAAAIRPEELFGLIEKVLQVKHLRRVTVSTTDLQKRLDNWVNRRPQPATESTGDDGVSDDASDPSLDGSTEVQLTALWQSFFGKQHIGAHDNFFDVGGDSLKALTMIGRMYKSFQVEVPIQEFFKRPTIRQLSDFLDTLKRGNATGHTGYAAIPRAQEHSHYPLSSAQQRLYFLYELDKSSVAYNLFQATTLKGMINREQLRDAFNRLLDRHEILRTAFVSIDGLPVQQIAQRAVLEIESLSASAAGVPAVINAFIRPFDLSKAPLIRAGLIEIAPDEHVLVVDMPHIISDGVSQGIMIKDFLAFYNGEELPALHLQYKDYCAWQQGHERQEKLSKHRDFLVNAFTPLPPPLDLPLDLARPSIRNYDGHTTHFYLDAAQTAALRSIASRENVSLFVLLLSSFNVLLRKLTNQEDIVTGTNTAGRRHPDLEQLIGIFVTTLPLRTFPAGNLTFREFLLQVQTTVLSFFEHEAYEYDALIDDLKIDRDQARNPLFDVLFLYQNFTVTRFEIAGLDLVTYDIPQTRSKFDLSLIAVENNDRLLFAFEYATALFSRDTIETFASYFTHILSGVIADMDTRIEDF